MDAERQVVKVVERLVLMMVENPAVKVTVMLDAKRLERMPAVETEEVSVQRGNARALLVVSQDIVLVLVVVVAGEAEVV